jgi:hypothetical protein
MIELVTNCTQIEQAVPDVAAACARFDELVGSVPIEQEVVARITGAVLDIDHRGCGDAVFQFCAPLIDDIPARHELDRIGPCVTNLTFYVADADGAAADIVAAGGTVRGHWKTSAGPWLDLMGPGNARSAEQLADGYFMGTRHLLGFDFEFSEPPWLDPAVQRYVHPAFTHPRPPDRGVVRKLQRLLVLVDDRDRFVGNLLSLIEPGSRTEIYDVVESTDSRRARVSLRGLELEYVEPAPGSAAAALLAERGPGITTVVFGVADLDASSERVLHTTPEIGFDIAFEQVAID